MDKEKNMTLEEMRKIMDEHMGDYANYRIIADDEIVLKKSELARLKNLELNYDQVYEEYRKLERERKHCRLIADDEAVIKKSEMVNVFAEEFEEFVQKVTAISFAKILISAIWEEKKGEKIKIKDVHDTIRDILRMHFGIDLEDKNE